MPRSSPHGFTRTLLLSTALIFLGLQIFPAPLSAQTVIPIYQFGPGVTPTGGLIADAAGKLYGTIGASTFASGPDAPYGDVYELTNSAGVWSQNVLYTFEPFNDPGDGWDPVAGVISDSRGDLIGTTLYGGELGYCLIGCGTIFGLLPQPGGAWKERVYKFHDDGNPDAGVVMGAGGNLYGTATGQNGAPGFVFELQPSIKGISTLTKLYIFEETKGNQGTNSVAPLIFDDGGNLYGTAQNGGQYKAGTAYRLSPGSGGWTFTALYAFGNGQDGAHPTGGFVMDASGNLYGTTAQGGTNGYGTVFELSPTPKGRWRETILHEFAAEDGEKPGSSLIFDSAGNLYGVAPAGGAHNCGTIFELSPSGGSWNFNAVYSFANSGDGCNPNGPLLDFEGNFYGVATTVAFEYMP